MGLMIDQYCFEFIGTCLRSLITILWSLILVCISIYVMYRTYSVRGRITYEFAPMVTCAFQALLNAFEYVFYDDNHLSLIQFYLSVITFAFLGQSFPNLYYRLSFDDYDEFKKFYRKVLIISLSFYFIMFIIQILLNVKVTSDKCNFCYFGGIISNTIQLTVTATITIIYGIRLLKLIEEIKIQQLDKKMGDTKMNSTTPLKVEEIEKSGLQRALSSIRVSSIKEATLIMEKQKQIKVVCYGISGTTILYIFIFVIQYFIMKDAFCIYDTEYIQKQSAFESFYENLFLGFLNFLQVTPCLYVPYVFYYIPVRKGVSDITTAKVQDIIIKDFDVSMQPNDALLNSDDLFIKNAQTRLSE